MSFQVASNQFIMRIYKSYCFISTRKTLRDKKGNMVCPAGSKLSSLEGLEALAADVKYQNGVIECLVILPSTDNQECIPIWYICRS